MEEVTELLAKVPQVAEKLTTMSLSTVLVLASKVTNVIFVVPPDDREVFEAAREDKEMLAGCSEKLEAAVVAVVSL